MAHKTWAVHYTTEHVELIQTPLYEDERAALTRFWDNHDGDTAKIGDVSVHHVNTVEDR